MINVNYVFLTMIMKLNKVDIHRRKVSELGIWIWKSTIFYKINIAILEDNNS